MHFANPIQTGIFFASSDGHQNIALITSQHFQHLGITVIDTMTLFHNYDVILSIQTPVEVPQNEKYLNAKVSDEMKELLRPCSH